MTNYYESSAGMPAQRGMAIPQILALIVGVIYTLVGTAEMNGWDPQAYLRVLLDRIADHPINRIGELAPWTLRPNTN